MEVKFELQRLENITLYVQDSRSYLVDLVLGIQHMELLVVNNGYFHGLKPRLMFGVSMSGHCPGPIYANSRLCQKLGSTFVEFDSKGQTHHRANDKLSTSGGIDYTFGYGLSHVKTGDPIRLIFYIDRC